MGAGGEVRKAREWDEDRGSKRMREHTWATKRTVALEGAVAGRFGPWLRRRWVTTWAMVGKRVGRTGDGVP